MTPGRYYQIITSVVPIAAGCLLACSSSGDAILSCSGDSFTCLCQNAAARSGSCSPGSLGGAAHCCATVDAGVTTACMCASDAITCCQQGSSCYCGLNVECFGVPVASCPLPSGGHCCHAAPGAACYCQSAACNNADEAELVDCSPATAVFACQAGTVPVDTCQ